jgi:capsular polysaccharide biosynthesis protein
LTAAGTDAPLEPEVSIRQIVETIRRRWWIVVLLPVVAFVATVAFQRNEPYQSHLRASVLIPEDNEETGNSERPELMVMDDLPPFIRSYAFAEGIRGSVNAPGLTVDDVRDSLDAERYSRILTILVTGNDTGEVSAIAAAAASNLSRLVNEYLMPDGDQVATVRIIDPPSEPSRSREGHMLQLLITTCLGVLIGSLIAITMGARDGGGEAIALSSNESRHTSAQD